VNPSRRIPAHFFVIRPTSVPVTSWMAKSQERQFSASIEPRTSSDGPSRRNRFFPTMFSWTIFPTRAPAASCTSTVDLNTLAGRTSSSTFGPVVVVDGELVRQELVDARD
jgi:hypothetical protein